MNSPAFSTPPKKILIIKPSAIGDVVHALPVLNLLRRRWPEAHIAWLVTPACAGLLEGHPQLNEVIRFERRRFGQGWRNPGAAFGLLRFTRELRRRNFDLAVDLQGLFRSGWLTAATRAPARIGFRNAREFGWIFYTHRITIDTMEQHAVERYLEIAEALGCGPGPIEFTFPVGDDDRRCVSELLPAGKRYAVLMPGANWPTKRWPVENFAALVAPLRERFELEAVVVGGPEDVELASRISGAVNLAGKTTLRQLVAVLERAEIVIANDTGPMHIAAALGRPLVTLFGPTNPVRTGPYRRDKSVVRIDIPCSPCYSRACCHQSCLHWLNVEHVLDAVEKELTSGSVSH